MENSKKLVGTDDEFIIKNQTQPQSNAPVEPVTMAVALPQTIKSSGKYFPDDPDNPENYKTAREYSEAMHKRHPATCAMVGWEAVWRQHQWEKSGGPIGTGPTPAPEIKMLPNPGAPGAASTIAAEHAAALKKFHAAGPTPTIAAPAIKSPSPKFGM